MIVQTKWQNSPDNDEIKVTRDLQCIDVNALHMSYRHPIACYTAHALKSLVSS
jgi:hypothetical protein